MGNVKYYVDSNKMVFSFLLSSAIDITVFVVKQTYSWGRYLVYGHEETTEEKLEKVFQKYSEIKQELEELKNNGDTKRRDDKQVYQSS